MPANRAQEFVQRHRNVSGIPTERMAKALDLLLASGLKMDDILSCPEVVLSLPVSIEHRIFILQEAGARTLFARFVARYRYLSLKRVSLLKAHGLIPQEVDVTQNMLGYVGEGPGPLRSLGDTATLSATNEAVLRHFLCWRLAITPSEMDRIINMYRRIKNKSLRLISRTLDILEQDLGFSRAKILNNGFLIHSHASNTLRMLREVPHVRGVPLKDIVTLHPKILMSPTDTLLRTLQYLEEFGVDDDAVRRNPEVLTLGSESVRERLEQIRTQQGLSGLQGHPRVLRLVQYLHKARLRLSRLQEMQVRCASLHVLCGTQSKFERYMQDGGDRTRGMDMVHFLASVLGRGSEETRLQLHKHPYWCHVPLPVVKQTCEHLLERGYLAEDIYDNLHLVLYPREKVEAELEHMWQRPELHTDVFLSACGGSTLPSVQQLALCLYFIERDYHFTGDGVWVTSSTDTAPSTSPRAC